MAELLPACPDKSSDRSSGSCNNPFCSLPILEGAALILKPLSPEYSAVLCQAASDPLIWQQHPDPLRYQRERFESDYLQGALASDSAFLVLDKISGDVVGCSRYYDWDLQRKEIAIGFTFLVRSHWGGNANRELKKLMLNYAFDRVNKVWFHIGRDNWRSRKAIEKVGADYSHQAQKEINGKIHEYVYYVIAREDYLVSQRSDLCSMT